MKIVPGVGLDGFSFGITEVDLISKLGNPDKIYTTDEGCRRLQFYNLKLELSFEPENKNRLGWIEVHNPKLKFDGNELFGLSEKDVIPIVSKLLNEEPKFEDFGSFLSVFTMRIGLSYNFSLVCLIVLVLVFCMVKLEFRNGPAHDNFLHAAQLRFTCPVSKALCTRESKWININKTSCHRVKCITKPSTYAPASWGRTSLRSAHVGDVKAI